MFSPRGLTNLVTRAIEENIQRDTSALRNDTRILQQYATEIKVNTDEIRARVNSIRHAQGNSTRSTRVQQWIEEIEILTSYAETTYQATSAGPEDLDSRYLAGEGRYVPVGDTRPDTDAREARDPTPLIVGHVSHDGEHLEREIDDDEFPGKHVSVFSPHYITRKLKPRWISIS